MRELSASGRLAAWGTAALTGVVSPDEAAEQVAGPHDAGHRVVELPGEDDGVNLAYAFGRLRALGATGLRLVLPRPGDTGGLPGPPAFNERAVEHGEAVVTLGQACLGLVPVGRGTWRAHRVEQELRTPVPLREAERDLALGMREAAELLARLDVARWDPAVAEALMNRSRSRPAVLPHGVPGDAHRVLDQALRLATIVELARGSDGAALSTAEMQARSQVLRDLDALARRAVEAACSPPLA